MTEDGGEAKIRLEWWEGEYGMTEVGGRGLCAKQIQWQLEIAEYVKIVFILYFGIDTQI